MSVYRDKVPSVVTPYRGSPVRYGFQTNIEESDRAALGHTDVDGAAGPVVFGANRPKPARMTRTDGTGSSTSSFVDESRYAALVGGNTWKRSKGVVYAAGPYNSPRSIRVVAEVAPGLALAWNMPKSQYSRIQATLPQLGIEPLNATNGRHAVTGSNSFEAVSLFGAKTRIDDDLISVKYVGSSQADSLPLGWTPIQRAGGGDPTVPAP